MADFRVGLSRNISHLLAALFANRADFHRRWANPGRGEERWEGDWVSEANGHCGALKCLLTKEGVAGYRATFHAVYAKFLTVCYTVSLQGGQAGGKLLLKGDADLGKLAGGVYHYEGRVDEAEFNCTYRCRYDHGTFHLKPWRR